MSEVLILLRKYVFESYVLFLMSYVSIPNTQYSVLKYQIYKLLPDPIINNQSQNQRDKQS